MKKPNHQADIKNKNKGTRGTNKTYDKAQGNKGKALNPNQEKTKKSSTAEIFEETYDGEAMYAFQEYNN